MLAVANSSFIVRYYDPAFHNKLYAGRRRFMTQYVKQFPLPSIENQAAQEAIAHTRQLVALAADCPTTFQPAAGLRPRRPLPRWNKKSMRSSGGRLA